MGKNTVRLQGGKLKSATYDEKNQVLEIEFVDGSRRAFKAVQHQVFERLVQSPNPASYFEDRIRDEYAQVKLPNQTDTDARSKLDDLFGKGSS